MRTNTKTINNERVERELEFLKEHYVTKRDRFCILTKGGEFFWAKRNGAYRWLHDDVLRKHLKGTGETISVFSERGCVKFITFDADTKENAKQDTKALIDLLKSTFSLRNDNILASFSGQKGYHVDVFFDKPVRTEDAYKIYLMVIDLLGKTKKEIEFRPLNAVAVKIPLGIHHTTGNLCYIVDNDTLERVDNDRIYAIEKISKEKAVEVVGDAAAYMKLNPDIVVKVEGEDGEGGGTPSGHETSGFNGFISTTEALKILKTGLLQTDGTRHNATLTLTSLLRGQGHNLYETTDIITKIMVRTFEEKRELLDETHTIDSILRLTEKKVAYIYDKGYKLQARRSTIKLNKQDLDFTFIAKGMHLRRLIFALILHEKSYRDARSDGLMEFSLEKFAEMYKVDKNGKRLMDKIRQLEDLGIVTVVSSNQLKDKDEWREVMENGVLKKVPTKAPNQYKLNLPLEEGTGDTIFKNVTTEDYEAVVGQFIDEKELKRRVSPDQWKTQFRVHYK